MTREHLTFDDDYVVDIEEGYKDTTVRYELSGIHVGDIVEARTPDGEKFADIGITLTSHTKVQHALDVIELFNGNHGQDHLVGLIEALNEHYDAEIGTGTAVTVVKFIPIQ